jgi:hypothetical protein
MCCMSCSAILLKVGLVNFFFFQSRNEEKHNILTVPLGIGSLREKMGPTAYATFEHKHQSSHHAAALVEGGLCTHQRHEFWLLVYPDKWKYASSVKNVTSKFPLLHGQESLKTNCSTLPTEHCRQVSILAQL